MKITKQSKIKLRSRTLFSFRKPNGTAGLVDTTQTTTTTDTTSTARAEELITNEGAEASKELTQDLSAIVKRNDVSVDASKDAADHLYEQSFALLVALLRPGACANDLAGIARDRGLLPFEGVRS